ncbi:MAG: hypothetical protein ACK5MW_01305 [Enterococcus sp.]
MNKIQSYFFNRQEQKKLKQRKKNAALRAQGKDPLKGWGKMIDSGFGGINKSSSIGVTKTSKLDNLGFLKEQSENIRKK